ncbi:unnamed protein product [Chironomus riparius]|uniref:Lipase domain-containing protein n=1 Tax=Chironomus riparius TaxID=315576 RepID=A0A9N9WX43_9DIPT|nr:unnamed protein product [Chironomus riparius]
MKTFILVLIAFCGAATAFDAYRDTHLMLQTRRNINNPTRILFRSESSLLASEYDRTKPTRILIHGWRDYEGSDISTATAAELLRYYDFNVIFVDWSEGSSSLTHGTAAARAEPVSIIVSSQLNWMRSMNFIDFARVQMIGFSMGAHIAGLAGKRTDALVDSIIGLDPSGRSFSVNRPDERLNAGDARHVECLHTGGGLLGDGIGAAICDADFFPNGGSGQPGCLFSGCDHSRSVEIYVESIDVNGFHSIRCQTEQQATRENCASGGGFWFNSPTNSANQLRGFFHFSTNRNTPFAQGPFRPQSEFLKRIGFYNRKTLRV